MQEALRQVTETIARVTLRLRLHHPQTTQRLKIACSSREAVIHAVWHRQRVRLEASARIFRAGSPARRCRRDDEASLVGEQTATSFLEIPAIVVD